MTAPAHHPSVWSAGRRISALRKWHAFLAAATQQATALMVHSLPQRSPIQVLDLACGAGEPALSIAAAVAPDGEVTATDLSAAILAVAQENARRADRANIRFGEAVAEALPFPDASFDAVTCRFGVMFFSDPDRAFREIRRVLRPGGRAIFAAWALGDQPYFAATIEIVRRFAGLTEPRESLDIYRFGRPELLAQPLRRTGLADATAEIRPIELSWPGPPEQVWQYFRETSTNHGPLLEAMPLELQERARAEALAALKQYVRGDTVHMPSAIILATGAVK
jgi:ubiquinone/menaquinone biosynthesis C-methylase UbiE